MMGVGNNGIDHPGHTVVLWCFLRFGQEKSLSGSFIKRLLIPKVRRRQAVKRHRRFRIL